MSAPLDLVDAGLAVLADELVPEVHEPVGGVAEDATGLHLGQDDPFLFRIFFFSSVSFAGSAQVRVSQLCKPQVARKCDILSTVPKNVLYQT